ncbi:dienelactone hydrolase family protein [Sphingomonas profundi]|uniref:dienelactone hydrolase family protein n=1 Tax=Alterirhizorhabdus profundi TaxID=2681549 RepID=UPI0012E702AC|nr:dienelactone hydrolase family protein [Sphingomonas profundi]
MAEMIEIETLTHDGHFPAYCAAPAGAAKAAIVVVQEIFGVNPGIRAKCDTLAAQGYLAIAPDLFWRTQAGVQLDPDVPEQFQQGFGLMQKTNLDLAIRDVEAAIRAARGRLGDAHAKVGVVGYCFGGRVAYLAATRTDADAAVGYYGGGIDHFLGESYAIGKPLLLHFAEQDHFIDAETRTRIHAALDGNRHVEIVEHPGVDHGFATEHGKRRDDAAAERADARTAAFFAEHLG